MIRIFIFAALILSSVTQAQNLLPTKNGRPLMPDEWLQGEGWPHHVRAPASKSGSIIFTRNPTEEERHLIKEVDKYFQTSNILVMALVDNGEIVHIFKKSNYKGSLLNSASVGKTVTAMSAGIAICNGRISLETRVGEVLPDFKDKAVGNAKLVHLLTMTSGSMEPYADSTITTEEDRKKLNQGGLTSKDLISGRWGDAGGGFLIKNNPGEVFEYKSTDPILVGMMVAAAYGNKDGENFASWQASNLLPVIKTNDRVILGQDKAGFAFADGAVRMTLEDWIRFGIFVQKIREEDSCLGAFVRNATKTQVKISPTPHAADMGGYGYFIWTNNKTIPNSYWAAGYGGQFIGWSTENNKMLVMFSTQERSIVAHRIAKFWFSTK